MRFRLYGRSPLSRRGLLSVAFAMLSGTCASSLFGQQFGPQFGQRFGEQFRQRLGSQFGQQPSEQFGPQFGQQRQFQDGVQVDFKQQLEKGLYARRPEEFAFIDRVVQMVELNQLSRELVTSTFLWARKKQPYPYVYFERGLKVRAARLGVTVQ